MPARQKAGTSRGPQKRGQKTREKILDAVLELAAEGGPRAVTYRAVAERAGTSQGVMTYHFHSHRELLAQAFALHLERQQDATAEIPTAVLDGLSSKERADLVFDFIRGSADEGRASYLATFELMLELARDPKLRQTVRRDMTQMERIAVQMLKEAGSPEPEADAQVMSAFMQGMILEQLARPGDRGWTRKARRAVTRMVELLAPG